MEKELFDRVDQYIEDLFVPEQNDLNFVIESMENAGMPSINVTPVQGKWLQMMARICRAESILEVGTLAGYSALCLAGALPENGKLITIELEPSYAEVARKNIAIAGYQNHVDIRIGDGLEVLQTLDHSFDLVFLDAHKPSYPAYLELIMPLVHSGSLIVADNVIRQGNVLDENSQDEMVKGVQQFNKIVAKDSRLYSVILPTIGAKGYDGMMLAAVK